MARAEAGLHDRHRDAQHAAGRPGRGHDGLLPRRAARRRRTATASSSSTTRRTEDLHQAVRQAHGGLRHRAGSADAAPRVPAEARQPSRRVFRSKAHVVLRSVRATVNALESQDVELCDEVDCASTTRSTARYHAIEKSVEQLLAQQSPVATDLRLVLAVLHNADPPRADRRPGGHDREADEALARASSSGTISSRGSVRWAIGQRRWCGSRSTPSRRATSSVRGRSSSSTS